MRIFITLLALLVLVAPAGADLADKLKELPVDVDQARLLLDRVVDGKADLAGELLTSGQLDVLSQMRMSGVNKERGIDMASFLLEQARSGDLRQALPAAMNLVTPETRNKMQLTEGQAGFIFGLFERLQRGDR